MALPTLQDAKDYLRITLPVEDGVIATLLARSKASIETWLGYPMIATAMTWVDYGRRSAFPGNELQLPGPFALSPAPVVTDVEGVVIDATTYLLDNRTGKIRSKYGGRIFTTAGAYTVVATIGLSAHPDYATRLEAVAGAAIIDMVVHLYENRNPAVESEGDRSLGADAIPPRIQQDLMALPGARGFICA